MADYRFSAQAISRGKGQSSVASAAYRSGARLVDERTGEVHDYTRKAGVIHSEVMTPEGTPEWMKDRAQLWNAVEAVETRKNSQLAREIQLSLPHELEPDQRRELVRSFIKEQFVNQGMIADVAIHEPSEKGDERNHHAHIMLTMRELAGEGFHPKKATEKARSWNSDEQLLHWREEWANHQNRALERYGHNSRVSHLSYEAQGIDREPSQHLGAVASDMERNGKKSRIGDENREIANDNSQRALDHIEAAKIMMAVPSKAYDTTKLKRTDHRLQKLHRHDEIANAQKLAALDLARKHDRQKLRLEDELQEKYGTAKATIAAELVAVDRRLEAKGVRKILRYVFGATRYDRSDREKLTAGLADIGMREKEQRGALERRQMVERQKDARKQNQKRDMLVRGISPSRLRQDDKPKPRTPTRGTQRTGRPDRQAQAKLAPTAGKARQKTPTASTAPNKTVSAPKSWELPNPQAVLVPKGAKGRPTKPTKTPEAKSFNEPTLADKTRNPSSDKLENIRGELKRPWERSSLSNENKRPWERDDAPKRRRAPRPSPDGGKGGGDK